MRVTDSFFWYMDSSSSLVTEGPRRRKKAGLIPSSRIFLGFPLCMERHCRTYDAEFFETRFFVRSHTTHGGCYIKSPIKTAVFFSFELTFVKKPGRGDLALTCTSPTHLTTRPARSTTQHTTPHRAQPWPAAWHAPWCAQTLPTHMALLF